MSRPNPNPVASDEEAMDCEDENQEPERLPPLSPQERILLLELVDSHKNVIECKRSDFGSIRGKQKAWTAIANEFWSHPGSSRRTDKQLKKAWENMKSKGKKEVTSRKRKLRKTGGGPPVQPISLESQMVEAIVPAQLNSLENEFDCDCDDVVGDVQEPKKAQHTALKDKNSGAEPEQVDTHVQDVECVKKPKKDPRSSIVDMEYAEHTLRMKTLALHYDTELKKNTYISRKLELLELENTRTESQVTTQFSTGVMIFKYTVLK